MKKKKEPPKLRLVEFLDTGMFPANIILSIGLTPDELYEHLGQTTNEHWVRGLSYHLDKLNEKWNETWGWALYSVAKHEETKEIRYSYYIILRNFDFSDGDYINLAHEVVHACQHILPSFLNRDVEHEGEAYLHSHIMRQILQHIRNNSK